jgi:hypothetical protein
MPSRVFTPPGSSSSSSAVTPKRKGTSAPTGIHRSSKRNKTSELVETKETNSVVSSIAIDASPVPDESGTIQIQDTREAPEEGKVTPNKLEEVTPNKLGLTPIIVEQLELLDQYRQESRGDTALTADQYATKLIPIYTIMQRELDVVSNRLSLFRAWLPALMRYVLGNMEWCKFQQKLVEDGVVAYEPTKRDLQHNEFWYWFIEHGLDARVRDSLAGSSNQLTMMDIRHAQKVVSSRGRLYILHFFNFFFILVA